MISTQAIFGATMLSMATVSGHYPLGSYLVMPAGVGSARLTTQNTVRQEVAEGTRVNDTKAVATVNPPAGPLPFERDLQKIRTFQDDWDDEGSSAPAEGALTLAAVFAEFCASKLGSAPSSAYAGASGDVGLIWRESGGFVDITFEPDLKVSFYARSPEGEELSGGGSMTDELIDDRIWDFIRDLA